jgi:hypothetical protein
VKPTLVLVLGARRRALTARSWCTSRGIASCRAAGRLVDALGTPDAHARTREQHRQRLGFRPRGAHDVAAPLDLVAVPTKRSASAATALTRSMRSMRRSGL